MREGSGSGAGARFAVTLRRLRSEAGLSQEELAERAGLSVRGLRYLERGVRHPYRRTVERISEALALEGVPSAALLAAAARLPASDRAPDRGSHRPPAPTGPLVGREHELEEALALLRRARVRLLTVTGPGGVGKTRFALEVTARLESVADMTAVWVPLAAVTDAASVPVAVARAVGVVPAGPSDLLEVLAGALEERVLLLDNAEQVAGAAGFVADLVGRCRSLTVIVTSRRSLGLQVEQRFPLEPLSTPAPDADDDVHTLMVNPAVDLFVRRAQAVDPHLALSRTNAHTVAAICRRLEGFPLALELTGARCAVLPPGAMSARLDRGLELLTSGAPDLPDRQRTMSATIAWSYDLLHPAARALFRHLCVFEGGASLPSIDALPPGPGGDVLSRLETLVGSSLLRVDGSTPDEVRYRMHELIRAYGVEQLAHEGEEPQVRRWHAHHFLALAEEAEGHFYGPRSAAWLDRLETEHANLLAALRWCRAQSDAGTGLRLAAALSWFWYVRGHATEGLAHLTALLAAPDSSASATERIAALLGAGQLAQTQGDYSRARALLEQAVTLGRTNGDRPRTAAALLAGGFVARIQEDYPAATTMLEEAADLAKAAGPAFVVAATRHHLGLIAADAREDLTTARALLDDSLRSYHRLEMGRFESLVLLSLADVAQSEGHARRAADLAHRSLELMRDTGERLAVHGVLDTLAQLAVTDGRPAHGIRLAGAAEHLRQLSGIRSWPVVERRRERWLAAARTALTPEEYQDCWDDGQAMTVSEALTFALREEPPRT
jgi:predicted ATPase/DNA-binding XRE family transcriptional regulator